LPAPPHALTRFVERQLARYRKMQRAGVGMWFGARVDGAMAGVLGLVAAGPLGRFQLVGTDPRFAGRSVCSTLVYEAARWGLEQRKLESLVIVTDVTNHAAKIYESVGFTRTETLVGLIKKPPAT
jgi:RimJ/RimL family protein N-acetyltransferase